MASTTVRVWVAGPRAWESSEPIRRVIDRLHGRYGIGRLLVMTGGAPGVDRLTEDICREIGIHVFACRACWPVGRAAGPIRNEVIAREFAPRLLIALHYFPLDQTNHRGTQSAIEKAGKYHIPVRTIKVRPELAIPSSVADNSPMGSRARAERGLPPKPKKGRRKRPAAP